jgi:hypothetical protein
MEVHEGLKQEQTSNEASHHQITSYAYACVGRREGSGNGGMVVSKNETESSVRIFALALQKSIEI